MRKHLLIIGSVWPEPKSSAAGSRMMQLIKLFQCNGYTITFASACAKSQNAFNLEHINVEEKEIRLNHSSFDTYISNLNPNVVLFDRFMTEEQFGWRVAEHCSQALRLLDTEDIHGLRKGRQQALKEGKPFDLSYLFNDTSKREIASIYRSDLSLIISETEMQILKQEFKVDENILYYLPFLLEKRNDEIVEKLPKFEERHHFLTIGNFLHPPNFDSVLYLKEAIWPIIRKALPKAEMHIYGSYVSQKALQLHNESDKFFIKGFAEDVNLVMQNAKVCLAPLRFGAGLKGKLIDAMNNGTPCVTTTIGAEGLYGDLEINGFLGNTPNDIAEAAIKLYTDKAVWEEKQQKGFLIIDNRFQKNQFQKAFLDFIDYVQKHLKQHRLNNFTGQMLQHHASQSTKYMSKWIEEKNK